MKRYLSLWFPDWPLTRLRRAYRGQKTGSSRPVSSKALEARQPFVLVEAGQHGLRIAAVNAAARGYGINDGLRFTDAKARCPDLSSQDIDRAADASALKALGHWLIRIAPLVAIDGLDGLLIETTGCAHLYGGEANMLAEISRLLERDGVPHRLGLASTLGAASALARAKPNTILLRGDEESGLSDLPVAALRLSEEAEMLLRRFGLTRIGQLYGIDRRALARRFRSREAADAVLLRLDQALGLRHEPLDPLRPAPMQSARLNCPEPIFTNEAIQFGLETLTDDLCAELVRLGQGAREFSLLAFRSDGGVGEAAITLARPGRTPKHILRLFREKIDRIDPGFGIDLLVLEARRTGSMETGAVALSGDLAASDTDAVALAALVDRIHAKLGEGTVSVVRPIESHIPERSGQSVPFEGHFPEPAERSPPAGPRPIRILPSPEPVKVLAEVPDGPPQRFVWRKVTRKVSRADGPERINPEWWLHTAVPAPAASPEGTNRKWLSPKLDPRADAELIAKIRAKLEAMDTFGSVKSLPRARDYYRIEDTEGRRYWVFREGLYGDGRGGHPEWFMHGLFA